MMGKLSIVPATFGRLREALQNLQNAAKEQFELNRDEREPEPKPNAPTVTLGSLNLLQGARLCATAVAGRGWVGPSK